MSRKIELTTKPGKGENQVIADLSCNPKFNSACVIEAFQGNILGKDVIDINHLIASLEELSNLNLKSKKKYVQEILLTQALSLQIIFTSLATKASHQSSLPQYEAFMKLALKAQNQSRSTLQNLMQILEPKHIAFFKQSNITTGPQQINNHTRQADLDTINSQKFEKQTISSI